MLGACGRHVEQAQCIRKLFQRFLLLVLFEVRRSEVEVDVSLRVVELHPRLREPTARSFPGERAVHDSVLQAFALVDRANANRVRLRIGSTLQLVTCHPASVAGTVAQTTEPLH